MKTKRSVNTRIAEHKRSCKLGQTEKSAMAEHALSRGHDIRFEEVEVLDRSQRYYPRLTREAIQILKTIINKKKSNILWLGMRHQIDGSSKTTAFYPPIAVDQKDRSGRGSRYKSRSFPSREIPRVASAFSVLGEGCPRLFLHPKVFGSGEWGMVFPLLRRQSGEKFQ